MLILASPVRTSNANPHILAFPAAPQSDSPYPTREDAAWWMYETADDPAPECIADDDLIDESAELARFADLLERGVVPC
jgi:hypothetical protein